MTEKQKLKTTFVLGLVPLTVGLTIFFWWWIGKAWFLTTFHELEAYGFYWIILSFFMAMMGLGFGLAYLFDDNRNVFKGVAGILCVLINIPAVSWVTDKQHDVEQRAYVRFYNQTRLDVDSLTISNSLYTEHLERLTTDSYRTGYFYPNYDEWDSSNPEIESVTLTLITLQKKMTVVMPIVYKGSCEAFVLDSTFALRKLSRGEY